MIDRMKVMDLHAGQQAIIVPAVADGICLTVKDIDGDVASVHLTHDELQSLIANMVTMCALSHDGE